MTPKKALFGVISLLGDLVIAYRTNLVVTVPKAFRTFHDQCPVHIGILAIFAGTFRVKGGGRFKASTFCFLTVVFSVVVAPSGTFSFTAILRSHFLLNRNNRNEEEGKTIEMRRRRRRRETNRILWPENLLLRKILLCSFLLVLSILRPLDSFFFLYEIL